MGTPVLLEKTIPLGVPSKSFYRLLNSPETLGKTSKSSVPVLSAAKPKVFPGFFAFLANCFGFPARPCTCMLAGAASSSALPWPLVSRPVSRKSRLRTLVFPGKTGGFAAEEVGFELSE